MPNWGLYFNCFIFPLCILSSSCSSVHFTNSGTFWIFRIQQLLWTTGFEVLQFQKFFVEGDTRLCQDKGRCWAYYSTILGLPAVILAFWFVLLLSPGWDARWMAFSPPLLYSFNSFAGNLPYTLLSRMSLVGEGLLSIIRVTVCKDIVLRKHRFPKPFNTVTTCVQYGYHMFLTKES